MDVASIIATLPPELREEVLLTADDTILRTLPPALAAEAGALQERAARRHFQYMPQPDDMPGDIFTRVVPRVSVSPSP
jgi:hypothetical protein